mmetsp:Transcript_2379/g.4085  ORF Transcript_2379/g.4085 Transcript_2379/m.4085 type:complete len:217 (-) Transcript_2379:272-922(-)
MNLVRRRRGAAIVVHAGNAVVVAAVAVDAVAPVVAIVATSYSSCHHQELRWDTSGVDILHHGHKGFVRTIGDINLGTRFTFPKSRREHGTETIRYNRQHHLVTVHTTPLHHKGHIGKLIVVEKMTQTTLQQLNTGRLGQNRLRGRIRIQHKEIIKIIRSARSAKHIQPTVDGGGRMTRPTTRTLALHNYCRDGILIVGVGRRHHHHHRSCRTMMIS